MIRGRDVKATERVQVNKEIQRRAVRYGRVRCKRRERQVGSEISKSRQGRFRIQVGSRQVISQSFRCYGEGWETGLDRAGRYARQGKGETEAATQHGRKKEWCWGRSSFPCKTPCPLLAAMPRTLPRLASPYHHPPQTTLTPPSAPNPSPSHPSRTDATPPLAPLPAIIHLPHRATPLLASPPVMPLHLALP